MIFPPKNKIRYKRFWKLVSKSAYAVRIAKTKASVSVRGILFSFKKGDRTFIYGYWHNEPSTIFFFRNRKSFQNTLTYTAIDTASD